MYGNTYIRVFALVIMVNRAARATNIDDDILYILKHTHQPLSTRQICLKINRAWHTVNSHCLKLHAENKLNVIRAGNITLWSINNGR